MIDAEPIPAKRHRSGTPTISQLLGQTCKLSTPKSEVTMPTSMRNSRFGLVGTLALAAFSLVALSIPLRPAKAQCLGVDLGVVCAGLGVPSAFSYRNPYYYG